jgi:iron complex transport system substrate-binding protein
VLSLDAHTLKEILASVQQVADAAGVPARGAEVVASLRDRLDRVRGAVAPHPRPRVLMLEWLDPPFAPGHRVPEMVDVAGGELLLGRAGERSRQVEWGEVGDLAPDCLLVEPCGYDLAHAAIDANRHRDRLVAIAPRAVREGEAWVLDSACFSRSGPRVVEGIEVLGRVFHPRALPEVSLDGRAARWH